MGSHLLRGIIPGVRTTLRDDALKRYEALKPQVTEMKAELMVGWE
uniref:Uncharacterized protein n=1 Tax=Fusarium oxysporum (strain Fo5176) TaxID=660025 RepID=A0A0D2X8N7_FUSOF